MWLDNLNAMKRASGLTLQEISEKSGISKGTINKVFSGQTEDPKLETIRAIVKCLGGTLDDLVDEKKKAPSNQPEADKLWAEFNLLDEAGKRAVRAVMRELGRKEPVTEPKKTRIIPLLGQRFAAGRGEPDFGNPWEDYEVPAESRADFAVRVSGNSMEPYLPDGGIALARRGVPVDGDVAVLIVDGQFLIKQVCEDYVGTLHLFALNRDRADADDHIPLDSDRDVRCLGTIIMDKKIPLPGRGGRRS